MSVDLAIIVPTRGRPENVRKVIGAWDFTNAWDVADLVLVADEDDPAYPEYVDLFEEFSETVPGGTRNQLFMISIPRWLPMVHKLELAVSNLVFPGQYFAVGFAGDDHLPRTINWAQTYLANLRALGTGMVYGDDGYQGEKLSTEWALTTDVIRAWGRMIPARVEHMYCDQALLEVMTDAGAVRYLPQVQIEHMHPHAKKASNDEQYARVNSAEQFTKDRKIYQAWAAGERVGHAAAVRKLRTGRPDESSRTVARRLSQRREARKPVSRRSIFPSHFRQVRNVTPEEIGVTLADLASQVPADQAIVELGVYHGASTVRLAWGARQGLGAHVWGIDPWELAGNVYGETMGSLEQARRWARHWVTSFGYGDRVTLIPRFSHEVAADWSDDQPRVGLLFVDGDHTYDGARRDIESWAPRLADGASIAVDDYLNENYPGVREAVDSLVENGLLEPVQVYHDRMAVTRLAGKVAGGAASQGARVTAITSEGVATGHPGTALTVIDQEPDEFDIAVSVAPVATEPGCLHPGCILDHPHDGPAQLGTATVTDTMVVNADEATQLQVSPGTGVDTLTLPQLRALAKARQIVLGVRKDKKADTIQAIREGR